MISTHLEAYCVNAWDSRLVDRVELVMDDHGLSFGLKTDQVGVTYQQILDLWLEADEVPVLEHAWLWDHMVPLRGNIQGPTLEAWTLLAALASRTRRLRLGVIATSNRLRLPAVLAKMAATVDIVSGGRLIFGIGAGGSWVSDPEWRQRVRREFEAYGAEIVSPADAIGALAEACVIVRQLWSQHTGFDFEGRYYRLKGAVCEPKPVQVPHPPILIAGGGERLALRVVAEHADVWSCPVRTPDELRHKSRILRRYCAEIGREPSEIVCSVQLSVWWDDLVGARRRTTEFVEAGATHVVLAPRPLPYSLDKLTKEVIEPVIESVGK